MAGPWHACDGAKESLKRSTCESMDAMCYDQRLCFLNLAEDLDYVQLCKDLHMHIPVYMNTCIHTAVVEQH